MEPRPQPRTLSGEQSGMGTMKMGVLDHPGYQMSKASDFYGKFILEVVPNNAYHNSWYQSNLRPVQPMQPRIGTRIYNYAARDCINAPDRLNVMYSHHPQARGRVSHLEEIYVSDDNATFAEARAMRYEGIAKPRLISFPMPAKPERYLWIDLSWPVRNILLPVSLMTPPGEKPGATYVQLNLRRLQGLLPTAGFMEDGSQTFSNFVGDEKKGLIWDSSAASVRVDLELLYKLLTLPRHMRKADYNPLVALQLHYWENVPYNPHSGDGNLNYPIGKNVRNVNIGVTMDHVASEQHGVPLQYPPPPRNFLVDTLNTLLSTALGFIPVVGPLLAFASPLVFKALEDPDSMDVKNLLTAEFGITLAGAIIGSAQGYKDVKAKPRAGTRRSAIPQGPFVKDGDVLTTDTLYSEEEVEKVDPSIMEPTQEEKEMAEKNGPKTGEELEEKVVAETDEPKDAEM